MDQNLLFSILGLLMGNWNVMWRYGLILVNIGYSGSMANINADLTPNHKKGGG